MSTTTTIVLLFIALLFIAALIVILNRRVEPFVSSSIASSFDPCDTLPTKCDCETYKECRWHGASGGCKKRRPRPPPPARKLIIDRPMYAKKNVHCSDLNVSKGQCMTTDGICKWTPMAATPAGIPLTEGGICEPA